MAGIIDGLEVRRTLKISCKKHYELVPPFKRPDGLAPNGTHFVRNEPRALNAITVFARETVTRLLAPAAQ